MNITIKAVSLQQALCFNSHAIKVIRRDGQVWMSGGEIGLALEYADPDTAIKKLFSRNADEFTATMTKVIKVMTAGGKQAIRFFSLRGAHLLAMFARTDKAKAFRVWVLDILDREVADLKAKAATGFRLDDVTKSEIESLCANVEFMRSWWARFAPGLRVLNATAAGNVNDNFVHAAMSARTVAKALALKSSHAHAAGFPWEAKYTERHDYGIKARGAV
jgi:prophage antirepressor-like protein